MANPDGAADVIESSARDHAVFIDSSLDTHMAMVVGEVDTVADLKKKIQCQHALCFPDIGEININSLQVKRRCLLYHLSDSMSIRSVFDGVKSSWSVYVDVCRMVKNDMEISVPLPKANGILRCLEYKTLADRVNFQLSEPEKTLGKLQKDDCLNGKDDCNNTGDAVRKVLDDLEIELEHMGDDHFRTSSSDTNKRVESEVNGNGGNGQMGHLGKKRKMDYSENQVDKNLLNDEFSNGHDNGTVTAKKKHKIQKKEKDSAKRSSKKAKNSTVDESDEGARDGSKIQKMTVTTSSVDDKPVGMLLDSFLEGQEALHSAPPADARLESENKPIPEDPSKDQSHVSSLPIDPTNVLPTGSGASHLDPATEHSSGAKITADGKRSRVPDATDASLSEVPTVKSELSTKRKKKKTKAKTLDNQLPPTDPLPMEDNEGENLKDTAGFQLTAAADKTNVETLGTQNMEDALQDPKQFPTNQTRPIEKTKLTAESPDNLSLEKPKADDLRYDHVAETPEVLHNVGAKVHLKPGKKAKKEKNDTQSGRKKNAKSVTENVETAKDDILSSQNPEYMGSNLERTNISHLRLVGETDEVLEGTAKGRNALDDVRGPNESDTQVVKVREANPEASQFKAISNLENHVHPAEKDKKKSKRKRSSATNPSEIKLKENTVFINPSQSNDDMNNRVETAEAEKGELANQRSVDGLNETAEKKNDKEVASAGTVTDTVTETADTFQVQRKHLHSNIGTTTVGDCAKGTKHSSATDEINFGDYFMPSQQKPEAVASGDVGIVNEEWITVKGNTGEPKVNKKSKGVQDEKKSQVESSQESLSRRQPHGAVLHSDTESFRAPKDRAPSTSDKQKLQSSKKRSKQASSEVVARHSPSASETLKSNSSHEATKLNKNQSKALSQYQLKSPVGTQRTKSKQSASKKSSIAEVKNAENTANRRKTFLSTNIFMDDNNESSEDDESVDSVLSAGTNKLDDSFVSDVSEMEDDTGFTTPRTVGQRKAAEAENDSSMNKYTLEMLRESARLEKAKRSKDSESQLDEFVPDSQADQNP